MRRRSWLLLAAIVLAGCGGSAANGGSHGGPNPGFGEARASAGNMAVVAAPAHVRAGGTVMVNLDLAGPADYDTGCVQTLRIWAVDASGREIWQQPAPEIQCMALGHAHLAAGKVGRFTAQWPVASSVAPGTYSVHGLFLFTLPIGAGTRVRENLPVTSIQVSG